MNQLYVVHSKWSVDSIREYMTSFAGGDVGPLKIIYDRKGHETDRTLVALDKAQYDKLKRLEVNNKSSYGFSISEYVIRKSQYPKSNETTSWYLKTPTLFKMNEVEIRKQLDAFFKELVKVEVLPDNCWEIIIPLKSRTSSEHGRYCYVNFHGAKLEQIVTAKLMIDNSSWCFEDQQDLLSCFWRKRRQAK